MGRQLPTKRAWGGPAYYRDSQQQQFIYYCGSQNGHLKAYLFSGNSLAKAMIGSDPNQSPQPFPNRDPNTPGGTTPTVSSNLQAPGTAVVWAIARQNPLRLQAFDATNLRVRLFDGDADHGTVEEERLSSRPSSMARCTSPALDS